VAPSRRIEDRIRNLLQKLIEAEENTDEFNTISAELRFAMFTLGWQIRTRLKNFPAELDRRSAR
jgi:CRISPR/Cas system CSM-associated protein Csm2 small subunit